MKKQILALVTSVAVLTANSAFAMDPPEQRNSGVLLKANVVRDPEEKRLIIQPNYRSFDQLVEEFLAKKQLEESAFDLFLKTNPGVLLPLVFATEKSDFGDATSTSKAPTIPDFEDKTNGHLSKKLAELEIQRREESSLNCQLTMARPSFNNSWKLKESNNRLSQLAGEIKKIKSLLGEKNATGLTAYSSAPARPSVELKNVLNASDPASARRLQPQAEEKLVNNFHPLLEKKGESIKDFAKRFCAQIGKFREDIIQQMFIESSFEEIPRWEHYEIANFALRCFEKNPQLQDSVVIPAFAKANNREDFLNFLTENKVTDINQLLKLAEESNRKNRLKQPWEVNYKRENTIYVGSKLYRFEEPNEYWTLNNFGSLSSTKLAKISYGLIHEVTEVLDVNTDHLSWDASRDISMNELMEMARLPNGKYGTRMEVDPRRKYVITFSLFPSSLEQGNNWMGSDIKATFKQLGISIWKADNSLTGLDFEVVSYPKKLEKLLNLFVEKKELPQEKATEFLEKVREF